MTTAEVPDFLTVEEAARVLRIGRTAAYQQAHRWLDTATEGLPVMRVGGSLRVPLAQFEQHYKMSVTAIPSSAEPHPPKRPRTARSSQTLDIPRSTPAAGRRKARSGTQGGLPFAG